MTRKPQQQDTSSSHSGERDRKQAPAGEPPVDNPNERLEQWEERYFEGPSKGGRGDGEPNP